VEISLRSELFALVQAKSGCHRSQAEGPPTLRNGAQSAREPFGTRFHCNLQGFIAIQASNKLKC
jgi:hypothetical protein